MIYRELGKTGVRVSLVGLGTGGPSRFGQGSNVPEQDVAAMVHRAFEFGVNFIDTSALYGDSEAMLGRILKDVPRDDYVLATKFGALRDGELATADDVVATVENSLRKLAVETVDILQFHALKPDAYEGAIQRQLPAVLKLKEQGKCRFVGLSETYVDDPHHETVGRALEEDAFDTFMIAYGLLNPAAEELVLDDCAHRGAGVICMVAVRRALSQPELLKERLVDAVERGVIPADAVKDGEEPLEWLVHDHVTSLPAAGYKFAAAHPAIGTVLTGTASIPHLEENVAALTGAPLPQEDMTRLRRLFGQVREPLGN